MSYTKCLNHLMLRFISLPSSMDKVHFKNITYFSVSFLYSFVDNKYIQLYPVTKIDIIPNPKPKSLAKWCAQIIYCYVNLYSFCSLCWISTWILIFKRYRRESIKRSFLIHIIKNIHRLTGYIGYIKKQTLCYIKNKVNHLYVLFVNVIYILI